MAVVVVVVYLSSCLSLSLKLKTSKSEQFCQTSSICEVDNIENETILRDFLNFWRWQHQKWNNSARLPSKMESWVQSWRPRTNAFCDSSTPSGNQRPDLLTGLICLMTTSLYVSCTAPATRNASFQILFKCPTPAIVFGNSTKPFFSLLARCGIPCACHANDIWTSKSAPNPSVSCTFDILLTSKCASRHNGVHFFDISTSKSGPNLVCFVHFDLETRFAPQRRALFRHRNF